MINNKFPTEPSPTNEVATPDSNNAEIELAEDALEELEALEGAAASTLNTATAGTKFNGKYSLNILSTGFVSLAKHLCLVLPTKLTQPVARTPLGTPVRKLKIKAFH